MGTVTDRLVTTLVMLGVEAYKAGFDAAGRAVRGLAALEERRTKGLLAAKPVTQGFSSDLADLASQYLTLTAVVGFATKATTEYAEAENTAFRAGVVLRNLGSSLNVGELKELGDEIQRLTGFDNDLVVSLGALLARFDLTGAKIKGAIPAIVDAAAATGKSAEEIALAVGRASQGSTRGLREFGIELKSTGDQVKDFDAAMAALEKRFGGAGGAFRDTGSGVLNNFKTSLGNFFEAVGERTGLITLVDQAAGALDAAAGAVSNPLGNRALRGLGVDPVSFNARGQAFLEGDPARDPANRVGQAGAGKESATEATQAEIAKNTKKTAEGMGSLGRFIVGGGAAAQGALNIRGLNAALRAGR